MRYLCAGDHADNWYQSQIIGIPDDIIGEACVAVVDPAKSENFTKLKLQLDVAKHIGSEFVFAHILTLEDLGLTQYPIGPGGKVRKPVLRDLVLEHLQRTKSQGSHLNDFSSLDVRNNHQDDCIDLVKSVWADLLHIDPAELDEGFSLEHFSDSLTSMRYCFEIERLTSERLTVADIRLSPTIKDQAKLVSEAAINSHVAANTARGVQQRSGPPTLADVVICKGQESKFCEIQQLAQPILALHGLTWDHDVEDCFGGLPIWSVLALLPATRKLNLRFAFHGLKYREIREALAETLKVQPLLASTGVTFENRFIYLQLRQSDVVLSKLITKERGFESVSAATEWGLHEPFELATHHPTCSAASASHLSPAWMQKTVQTTSSPSLLITPSATG